MSTVPAEALMQDEIARLRAEVAALRGVLLSGRQVDLVDFGQLKVFMYMDDLAYQQVPPHRKNTQPTRELYLAGGLSPQTVEDCWNQPSQCMMGLLLCHFWRCSLDFTYFDVGCQYGSSAVVIAQTVESCGQNNRVVCFEPGVARGLVPHNIRLNRLEHRVTSEALAVSDGSYPSILYTELAHSENNRIVNRTLDQESLSYVVYCTSIDDYVRAHGIATHLILKIDTQGAEFQVWSGMRESLASRHVCYLMEYTPWALSVNAEEWLKELGRTAFLIDVGHSDALLGAPNGCTLVRTGEAASFTGAVRATASQTTDILVLPRELPRAAELMARLGVPLS